eukprot:scaffold9427_cov57-Phaeocystis_antarctica.AAC.1
MGCNHYIPCLRPAPVPDFATVCPQGHSYRAAHGPFAKPVISAPRLRTLNVLVGTGRDLKEGTCCVPAPV